MLNLFPYLIDSLAPAQVNIAVVENVAYEPHCRRRHLQVVPSVGGHGVKTFQNLAQLAAQGYVFLVAYLDILAPVGGVHELEHVPERDNLTVVNLHFALDIEPSVLPLEADAHPFGAQHRMIFHPCVLRPFHIADVGVLLCPVEKRQ